MIEIKRVPKGTDRKSKIYPDAKKSIGSRFTKTGVIHSGLDAKEIETILPGIIGVERKDVQFLQKMNEFYSSLNINIPPEGVVFNVEKDKNGQPVDPFSYIKYKFALGHPKVANSRSEIKPYHEFYINNVELIEKEKKEFAKSKRDAYRQLDKLSKKNQELLAIILGIPNTDEAYEIEIDNNPQEFINKATDEDLDTKAFIYEAIKYQCITNIGSTYIYEGKEIGNSMEEAVMYFKKPENSEHVVAIKAKIKNFMRNE